MPDGFVFSVKGPRFATNRRVLAEAGDLIKRFIVFPACWSCGDRLGPMLWQFAPTKKFDAADFGKFLELLPREAGGRNLRHVVEVRHASFRTAEFVALMRTFALPVVFTDHVAYPSFADLTADFVYARLQRGQDDIATAYPKKDLDAWAGRLKAVGAGRGEPDDRLRVVGVGEQKAEAARRLLLRHSRRQGAGARLLAMALIERLNGK